MTRFEIDTLKHGDVESIRLRGDLVLGQPINDLRQKMDNLASHGQLLQDGRCFTARKHGYRMPFSDSEVAG